MVDIFKNRGKDLVWTYIITLNNNEFHPAQSDFESEAIRLSIIDKRGKSDELSAKARNP